MNLTCRFVSPLMYGNPYFHWDIFDARQWVGALSAKQWVDHCVAHGLNYTHNTDHAEVIRAYLDA